MLYLLYSVVFYVKYIIFFVNIDVFFFFFQAEDGIRDAQESRGLGDVYKRQVSTQSTGRVDVSCWTRWMMTSLLSRMRTVLYIVSEWRPRHYYPSLFKRGVGVVWIGS
eukprot:TRINITY_DN41520_c0_g1_i1.p2 TRINITY_DN41520_c0_g1~~TRINITY_DN41520_c0_g1_i1.p2  ORF type:complete len:108 (-),score=21.71 TRINITY_DN41520_c0_g1_i1:489-812(-)